MGEEVLLSVAQVAARLGISAGSVYRRIYKREIPVVRAAGSSTYMVREVDIEAFVKAGHARHRDFEGKIMLTTGEAATALGFSQESIRKMCEEGRLPFVRGNGPGGHFRIPRRAVETLIEGRAA